MKASLSFAILIIGIFISQSSALAASKENFEKLLLNNQYESALNELSALYKYKIISVDEMLGLHDFMSTELLQSISSFNESSNRYITTKNKFDFNKAQDDYDKLFNKNNESQKTIYRAQQYYSHDFFSKFTENIENANKQMSIITETYNTEIAKQNELSRKQVLDKQIQKEESEKRTIIEGERQKKAEAIYRSAVEWASNNSEYKEPEITCEICQSLENKKEHEEAITKEKSYSRKYGVVNLSSIEESKVGIIRCDDLIREKSIEYRTITNTKFTSTSCSKIRLPCDELLENIKNGLVEKYLADHQAESLSQ